MKKLDILILKAFIGPFIATFFITLFVLVLQFFWLWIDDYVGKGIDSSTILQLMVYLSATLVPLALPLAILLSSIMTFGNLGETFELVAIKSAGIGLLRFMAPLFVVAILLSGVAFGFNNNVIPVANLKMRTLHTDIVNKKPAFDLKEGVFYTNIPDFAIKVGKKEDDDSTLSQVIIYEANPQGLQDNMIVAESGVMQVTGNQRFLEFTLYNGMRIQENGDRYTGNTDFVRLGFKEYKKVIDLSELQFNQTADSTFKDRVEMLSIRQLNTSIDSLYKVRSNYLTRMKKDLTPYMTFIKNFDSGWVEEKTPPVKVKEKDFIMTLPDSARAAILDLSISYINSARTNISLIASDYTYKQADLRMHLIEWHKKITMSIAVLVLFMIGAPLGSIVRKGGIGTPVVFAVIFFVIFFLLNNFGIKLGKEGALTPFSGMWLATFVLLPIGLFLTYKALRDSTLFNKEAYYRIIRKFRRKK